MIALWSLNSVEVSRPVIEPYVSKAYDTSLQVFANYQYNAELYAILVGTGASDPPRPNIELGKDADGDDALASDSKTEAGSGVTFNFTGLEINTQYKVYIVSKVNGYYDNTYTLLVNTISDMEELRSSIYRHNGDNVDITGSNIDKMINSFGEELFDFVPRTTKAVLFTGINGQLGFRFNGTDDQRYEQGVDPFDSQILTYYCLFKVNNTTTRQTIFTQQIKDGNSTNNGISIDIARSASNKIDITYRDQSPATYTLSYDFTDTSSVHLIEVKFESVANGSSKMVIKLDGANLYSASNLDILFISDEFPVGQIGGFSDANLGQLNGDIYEDIYFMCYQTTLEEDVVYNQINSKYGTSFIRADD